MANRLKKKTPPAPNPEELTPDKEPEVTVTAAKIQKGHLDNMDKMYYDGKLKVAGPFGDGKDWQGIFIFDFATKEEVQALLKTDPAIAAGRLIADIRPWYTAPTGSFVPGKPKA